MLKWSDPGREEWFLNLFNSLALCFLYFLKKNIFVKLIFRTEQNYNFSIGKCLDFLWFSSKYK